MGLTFSFPNFLIPANTTSMTVDVANRIHGYSYAGSFHYVLIYETIENLLVQLTDDKAPTVTGISSPAKTFKTGEKFPIVVTFSEPVVQTSGLTLTLKDETGKTYLVNSENPTLINSKASFMFNIPAADADTAPPITLYPVSISGVTDPSGNIMNN